MKARILDMADNVSHQQNKDLSSCNFLSICLNESTDITGSARLAIFGRYLVNDTIREELISFASLETTTKGSPVALQLRAPPPKVSARAPAHRSYHFRGVKLKSCIRKIHHNLYISKQANVRIKHADTEGASHKKFGTDARVQ